MIMLGAVVEATRGVEPSVMEQVLQSAFGKKPQIAKLNIAAFRRGMEAVRSQRAADEEGGSVLKIGILGAGADGSLWAPI